MNTIKIYIDKRREYPYPVYIAIRRLGKRFLIPTDIKCSTDMEGKEWSKKEPNYAAKNRRVLSMFTKANDVLLDAKAEMSNDELKRILQEKLRGIKAEGRNFISYLDEFISLKTKKGTRHIYLTTRNKILEYDPDVTLEQITKKWLTDFENHYLKTMSINGLAINLRNIRAVFNYCLDEEYTTCYPFRKFKIRHEETKKRCLSLDELRRIRDCKCEPFMEKYRDCFMLMVYLMGINAQDLFLLPTDSVKGGRISYHRKKTNRLYDICVPKEAKEILDRYKGKKYLLSLMDGYENPLGLLKHMNDALKHLGMQYNEGKKWSGEAICPELTTYYSRHTFGTLCAGLDIPKETIAACLGHSSNSVTDIYIKFDNRKIDEAQRKVIDCINADRKANR